MPCQSLREARLVIIERHLREQEVCALKDYDPRGRAERCLVELERLAPFVEGVDAEGKASSDA